MSALSLDEMFAQPDEPATEPVPPRTDEQEYMFEADPDATPQCREEGNRIIVRVAGGLSQVHPPARGGERVSLEELRDVADAVKLPDAFRPPWLGVMTAPRLRPRPVDVPIPVGGVRPLIFESPATEWPWTPVGKLFVNVPGRGLTVGSGVLVGPRLLLTASHAMPWGTDNASIRFAPCFRDGNDPRFGDAFVEEWRGVRNEDDVTGLDYVICKLNWRIGERTGWLGSMWSSDEDFYTDDPWLSTGYPSASPSGGQRPSAEVPVWVRDLDNEGDGLEIETHLFAMGGWSGGPLWGWRDGQPRVVGIESGFENDVFDPTRTVFGGGEHLVDLVKYGYAHWG
jgi:V8-like Glu-specific endopeptidase